MSNARFARIFEKPGVRLALWPIQKAIILYAGATMYVVFNFLHFDLYWKVRLQFQLKLNNDLQCSIKHTKGIRMIKKFIYIIYENKQIVFQNYVFIFLAILEVFKYFLIVVLTFANVTNFSHNF